MKLIVLDRDGVINYDSRHYIRSPEEWIPIESSLHAIARLHQAGFIVVVCTNQSGIGRGYYSEQTLAAIHQKMHDCVEQAGGKISGVYYCPHHPDDGCACRKPKPGLLAQVARDYEVDLRQHIMVGDRLSDVRCALAKQMKPILVTSGIDQEEPLDLSGFAELETYSDLMSAVPAICNHAKLSHLPT